MRVGDIGKSEDASAIQYDMVRVGGQKSTYIPIMKAGGDTNTIAVVNSVKELIAHLYDVPAQLKADLLFDQSVFVKEAINTVGHEGLTGLVLTGIMILLFLGNGRATFAVMLSIPLSVFATVIILKLMGATLNTMILSGIALAFSRVIDNSVISLENIYRHLEMGSLPKIAAEIGGNEVVLAVLAATLVDVVDFFPVTFLYGVSKFLFSALALAFCISLMVSFVVAMTVIPLFCSRFLKAVPHSHTAENQSEIAEPPAKHRKPSLFARFNEGFNNQFNKVLDVYERAVRVAVRVPLTTVVVLMGISVLSLGLYPFIGLAFFPQTDAGQFTVNLKAPTGTRIELTNDYVAKVENLIKQTVAPEDFRMTVSNIGVVPDFSSLYTTNAGTYMATVQAQLTEDHKTSSYVYMAEVQRRLREQYPELRAFFQSGAMVDAIINTGMPAPIDVQVSSPDIAGDYKLVREIAAKVAALPETGQTYIPQDMDYPGIQMNVNRVHAAELGLTQKDVVTNVITALNSDVMIAPNYWVDRKTGNDYFLTVQYYEQGKGSIRDPLDLTNIPLRAPNLKDPTTLDTVVNLQRIQTPTEIDHYSSQRSADLYVTPKGEALNVLAARVREIVASTPRARQRARQSARHGGGDGRVLQELRHRFHPLVYSAVSDSGGAVQVVRRSGAHHACHSHERQRRAGDSALDAHDGQRDVAYRRFDARRYRQLEQHSDCRFRPSSRRTGFAGNGCGDYLMPRSPASDSDDVARDHHRHASDGPEARHGSGTVCADGARDHRRPDFVGDPDGVHRPRGLPAEVPQPEARRTGSCVGFQLSRCGRLAPVSRKASPPHRRRC